MWTVLTPGDGEITIFRFVWCFQERKMKRDLSWSSNFGLKERKLWRYLKSLTAGKIKMLTQQKKWMQNIIVKIFEPTVEETKEWRDWSDVHDDKKGGRVCLTTGATRDLLAGAASPESRTGPGKRLSRTASCRDFSQPTLSPLPADQEAREHCTVLLLLYRTSLDTTDYTTHHTYSSMLILESEEPG